MNTHNICFCGEIRKLNIFQLTKTASNIWSYGNEHNEHFNSLIGGKRSRRFVMQLLTGLFFKSLHFLYYEL